jgi:hypothetical protein
MSLIVISNFVHPVCFKSLEQSCFFEYYGGVKIVLYSMYKRKFKRKWEASSLINPQTLLESVIILDRNRLYLSELQLRRNLGRESLYQDMGWEKLSSRRERKQLCLMYNMYHGHAPSYLCDLLPPFRISRFKINFNFRRTHTCLDALDSM